MKRGRKPFNKRKADTNNVFHKSIKPGKKHQQPEAGTEKIRINRYIANAGICSRREADELIKQGHIQVNGELLTEPGMKVGPEDDVLYKGKPLMPKEYIYLLLNKPKDTITTTADEKGRRTVMDILGKDFKQKIYPVGRLDRHTTGVLLLTNDGDLAQLLTHPRNEIEKIYHVLLDKPVSQEHINQLVAGIKLEDGMMQADEAAYCNPPSKREVGIVIHSGKNRIVRRMFEALGYEVKRLDRTAFAGLTKSSLKRGHWRQLTTSEIRGLHKIGKKAR